MDKNEKNPIRWAKFKDKTLEREYYNAEVTKNLRYKLLTILIASIIYFLFIIPEYFIVQNSRIFLMILSCRIFVLTLIFILYFKLKSSKDYNQLIYWIAAGEIIVSISFIYISSKFDPPNFLIQSFGLMVIILGIFLVNNRWLYTIFIAIFIAIGYFIFAAFFFDELIFSDFLAGVIHIVLIIFLTSISSYRINYYRRRQYLNSKELLIMAETDALTGIYNKGKFNREYARMASHARENKEQLSIVIFDIDNFKEINDQFGHLAGDDVLVALTDRVGRKIKKTDIFARWGGEEFVLVFPGEDLQGAKKAAERLRKIIADEAFKGVGQVTCSFGVASFKGEQDPNLVLKRADERLYQAKNSGRNQVV